ncbi:MAG: polyprenyl diphosphate synthase [Planctomycetota bacterium]|nr:polyprenyl diphosphate synthase [Planctomycetota bacterium]
MPLPRPRLPEPIRRLVYRAYEGALMRDIRQAPVPGHVGFIMDGNRRHAQANGQLPWEGHRLGSDTVEALVEWGREIGVRTMTLYAFSTENFQRADDEVDALMGLFATRLAELARDDRILANGVRVRVLGRTDLLPAHVQAAIGLVEHATAKHEGSRLNFCIAYGGRQEICDAMQTIIGKVERGELKREDIDETVLGQHLYTGGDDPDLIIRTGGESRLSNFLLYQAAYSELFFTDVHFPSFRKVDFLRILRSYQHRKRRFGR